MKCGKLNLTQLGEHFQKKTVNWYLLMGKIITKELKIWSFEYKKQTGSTPYLGSLKITGKNPFKAFVQKQSRAKCTHKKIPL
jgi:hypothetical protein